MKLAFIDLLYPIATTPLSLVSIYDKLIDDLLQMDLDMYSSEEIQDKDIKPFANNLKNKYFNIEKDDFDGCLEDNIIKIVRHISQTGYKPEFLIF